MESRSDNSAMINADDFLDKIKHMNTLFNFLRANKVDQFIEYIDSIDVSGQGLNINSRDEQGNYLIQLAVTKGIEDVVVKLLTLNCKIDIIDNDGLSLLYYPIKYRYNNLLSILLKTNKDHIGVPLVQIKDSKGQIPLHYAIRHSNYEAFQELLNYNSDPNYKNKDNLNALHLAVIKKDTQMVRLIVKYVTQINTRSGNGDTALHYACNFQLSDIVQILLTNNADPNIIEPGNEFTPLFYSVFLNNIEITKQLLEHNSDPNFQDNIGNTPLHYAAYDEHYNILKLFLDKHKIGDGKNNSDTDNVMIIDYDINHKTGEANGAISITKYPNELTPFDPAFPEGLVRQKNNIIYINPNIINLDGVTVSHILAYEYNSNSAIFLPLLLPFVNLNLQDNKGNTILHILCHNGKWRDYKDILSTRKMNVFIKNK